MSKDDFTIQNITRREALSILLQYHYLKDISKTFKSCVNYGLFNKDKLVGVCIFTGFPVPEIAVGMLGLQRNDQAGLWELSRLCIEPEIQKTEHNITSWFVSRCVKLLKKQVPTRLILSYADADYHSGIIYRACNFEYYGLTAAKNDFWILQTDGTYIKHSRGKTKDVAGEWRKRTQKHRFILNFDKTLKILWEKQ